MKAMLGVIGKECNGSSSVCVFRQWDYEKFMLADTDKVFKSAEHTYL